MTSSRSRKRNVESDVSTWPSAANKLIEARFRYNRRLQRVHYTSALFSIRRCEESRRFYDRKRAEGKRHTQAVLALARRRVNVLWALSRDGRRYELTPPAALAA